MRIQNQFCQAVFNKIVSTILLIGIVACTHAPFPAVESLRGELAQLKANEIIAGKAPVALYDAEKALQSADEAWRERANQTETESLVYVAKRKLEIAKYTAQRKISDDEFTQLKSDREHLLLEEQNQQVQQALTKVHIMEEKVRQLEAEKVAQAKVLADQAQATLEAQKKSLEEQVLELKELQARKTERGMVITIGDVLFATGKADLIPGAQLSLNRLVTLLKDNTGIDVLIEGHTDNVGADEMNNALAMQRAQSVGNFLTANGISATRITATGYGKAYPIVSNEDATGRQMNRRVEILLLKDGDSAGMLRKP